MLRAVTWCAKCLFIYFIVAVVSTRLPWIFAAPVWNLARQMHWTDLNRLGFVLSYFLPIYAIVGLLIGLIPFGKIGKAIRDLLPDSFNQQLPAPDPVSPILWTWLPVTVAFLYRFFTWQSRTSSVLDTQRSAGRVDRFFGSVHVQTTNLLDTKWMSDRFVFTAPMLFLIACALAVYLRHRLTGSRVAIEDSQEL
jgi:hypothetical protein